MPRQEVLPEGDVQRERYIQDQGGEDDKDERPCSYVPALGPDPTLITVKALTKELIIACADHGAPSNDAQRRMLRVLGDQLAPAEHASSMLPTFKDARLVEIQHILEEDMTQKLTLEALGRLVGASSRTLNRVFRSEAGMSFVTFRNQLRLHSATLMLAEGHSVTRVASDYGYSSPSAFITAFKAAFGRTPGALYS